MPLGSAFSSATKICHVSSLILSQEDKCINEVFWGNVLNIYTHALVHVSTGEMHQVITVEGTRFVMVLSSWVTSFHCWAEPQGSSAGPRAGALDPNLAPEGQDFDKSAAANRSAPSANKLPLTQLAPAVVGIGGELAEGCRSRYVEAG